MFNPSTHKVFASRDVIFHEQVDEGNKDRSYEEWNMPSLIDENNDEAKYSHLQQEERQKKNLVMWIH